MDNRGLLFIPDISGFTRFVTETEIDHSRLIIQELLETLIEANEIGLEISEIEGDAILFYKFGEQPSVNELYRQVEKMFCDFHKSLAAYDQRRYCQCKACMSAVHLTLKVITHYGEFAGYHVRNFNKLIGKDIIVAHQLLKNDIDQHEYWLITDHSVKEPLPVKIEEWMKWNSSAKQTETGEIPFFYTQLGQLKERIQTEPPAQLDLSNKIKLISVSREYNVGMVTLFHAVGDFAYRNRWMEGVKAVEEMNHFLPRVGMRGRCILETGEVMVYSSSYSFDCDHLAFTETDEKDGSITYYNIERLDKSKSRFTLEYYLPESASRDLVNDSSRKYKMKKQFEKSLLNLEQLAKELKPAEADLL